MWHLVWPYSGTTFLILLYIWNGYCRVGEQGIRRIFSWCVSGLAIKICEWYRVVCNCRVIWKMSKVYMLNNVNRDFRRILLTRKITAKMRSSGNIFWVFLSAPIDWRQLFIGKQSTCCWLQLTSSKAKVMVMKCKGLFLLAWLVGWGTIRWLCDSIQLSCT